MGFGDLWNRTEEDLRVFDQWCRKATALREPLTEEGEELINDFAFRRNGTSPTAPGTAFVEWFAKVFLDGHFDDPEAYRPPNLLAREVTTGHEPLKGFLDALDMYRQAIQDILKEVGDERFTYQGFEIRNYERMSDTMCRTILEGVDYVVALFKRRGMEHLLSKGVTSVELVPSIKGESNTYGEYWPTTRHIVLTAKGVLAGKGTFIAWVNEIFLHEFGHFVHLAYLPPDAKAVWDQGWDEVRDKKKQYAEAFEYVTASERSKFFNLLESNYWDVSRVGQKLKGVAKIKFGVWLRSPLIGGPLITPKAFRLTKDGEFVASFFRNPTEHVKERRGDDYTQADFDHIKKQMLSKLGLGYNDNLPITVDVVEELRKSDPSMQRAVDDALAKLDIVSDYGKMNEKEDFAESFVAFLAAPEKLTQTAKFRMQQALSLAGLYGKPVMRLAGLNFLSERFGMNCLATRVVARYLDHLGYGTSKGWLVRKERDQFVEQNIERLEPHLLALWRKMKNKFKGTPDRRYEQFLEYVHEHPGEDIEHLDDLAEATLKKWERDLAKKEREWERIPGEDEIYLPDQSHQFHDEVPFAG
jgi:hypothetical protein